MVPLIPKFLIFSFRDIVESPSSGDIDDGDVSCDWVVLSTDDDDDDSVIGDDDDDGDSVTGDDDDDGDSVIGDDDDDNDDDDDTVVVIVDVVNVGFSVCSLSSFNLFSTHFLFCSVAVGDDDDDDDDDDTVGISGISSDVTIVTAINSSCLASDIALTVSCLAIAITESIDSTSSLLSLALGFGNINDSGISISFSIYLIVLVASDNIDDSSRIMIDGFLSLFFVIGIDDDDDDDNDDDDSDDSDDDDDDDDDSDDDDDDDGDVDSDDDSDDDSKLLFDIKGNVVMLLR